MSSPAEPTTSPSTTDSNHSNIEEAINKPFPPVNNDDTSFPTELFQKASNYWDRKNEILEEQTEIVECIEIKLKELEAKSESFSKNTIAFEKAEFSALNSKYMENKKRYKEESISQARHLLGMPVDLSVSLRLTSSLCSLLSEAEAIDIFLKSKAKYCQSMDDRSIDGIKDRIDAVWNAISHFKSCFSLKNLIYLHAFFLEQIEWLQGALASLLKRTDKIIIIANYWNQLVVVDSNFATIGCSWLALVRPIFIKSTADHISRTKDAICGHLNAKLGDLATFNSKAKVKAIHNGFCEIFNQQRAFAIPEMRSSFCSCIEEFYDFSRNLMTLPEEMEVFDEKVLPMYESLPKLLFNT